MKVFVLIQTSRLLAVVTRVLMKARFAILEELCDNLEEDEPQPKPRKPRSKRRAKPDGPSLPHAYICGGCALRLGGSWPPNHLATCHADTCKYCNEPKDLASISDYNWPHVDLSAGRD